MSVRFTVGLPGHGKGLFNVHEIARFLTDTDRHVVTSMTEIKVPELTEWLLNKKPNQNLTLNKRLHFIEKKDVSEFYRYRGDITLPPAPKLPKNMSEQEKDTILEEYFRPLTVAGSHGVEYFLTEAHRHFKADKWGEMTDVIMFYMTQHRHFDDNVWVETQLPKQVVVQFRDLCDECIEMRNHYKERFGWFQKPGCFRVNRYYQVPKPGSTAEPFAKGKFYLDVKGLANCYRTRGAVAEGTGQPETQTQKKALPFWTIFVFAAAAIAGVCLLIVGFSKATGYAMGAVFRTTKEQTEKATGTPARPSFNLEAAVPVNRQEKHQTSTVAIGQPGQLEIAQKEELSATGYAYGKKGLVVQLSDGSRKTTVPSIAEKIRVRGIDYTIRRAQSPGISPPPAKREETSAAR